MLAFFKNKNEDYYVMKDNDGRLVWDYGPQTKDEIYSDDFAYKPPSGKTKDEVYINNMKPLCEIEYTYKKYLVPEKKYASLIIETELSLLLRDGDDIYRYDKENIEYEIVYEQENLDFIDEL